ncbi:MAG: hypothetical protein PVG64_02835 [Syntrophobacterales bacterium]
MECRNDTGTRGHGARTLIQYLIHLSASPRHRVSASHPAKSIHARLAMKNALLQRTTDHGQLTLRGRIAFFT